MMMTSKALVLTPDERIAYPWLFSKADTDQIGVLVGDKAVAFFAHSKLPPTILGQIWQLADQDNAGFLTRNQFDIALRLIGKAQRGLPVNEAAISSPGPLCRLQGIDIPGISLPTSPLPVGIGGRTGTPSASSSNTSNPLNNISSEDKVKYTRMFVNAGPQNGLLEGDKARDIFIRSKLSFEKLGQIWTLSDTQSRGALSVGDFCIAMHLIQLCMSGRLSTLPSSLPHALLESVTGALSSSSVMTGQITGTHSTLPLAAVNPRRQTTLGTSIGSEHTEQPASILTKSLPPVAASASTGASASLAWDISSTELAQSNVYFDTLEINHQGFITGDRAVPFMMESKLPGEILAQIWDLADIRGEGKLNREEFAVAMRLIQDTLAGGSEALLSKLPTSMVPPSLRGYASAGPQIPEGSDTQRDLLSLMDDEPPQNATVSVSPTTQSIPLQPTGSLPHTTPLVPHLSGVSAISSSLRVASSSPVHQPAILSQLTGRSVGLTHAGPISEQSEDSGAKLGNLQTQLTSTGNALTRAADESSALNSEISDTENQIKDLETKLLAARAALQSELPIVEELRTKQSEQRLKCGQLTSELIAAESELSALKLEKSQIEDAILHDKEEVRDTRKKLSELEQATQQLKLTLETLRKDSRLQKGLVAIGKKQVVTAEGQMSQATQEVAEIKERLSTLSSVEGGSQASSSSYVTPMMTASLPQTSSNPFDRMLSASPARSATLGDNDQPTAVQQLSQTHRSFLSNAPLVASSSVDLSTPTLSFGDAFGFDEQQSSNRADLDVIAPSPQDVTHQASPSQAKSSNPALEKSTTGGGASEPDESSDEDEIEDATASHLPSSIKAHKFPPLEIVESLIDPSTNHRQTPPLTTASEFDDAFYSALDDNSDTIPSGDKANDQTARVSMSNLQDDPTKVTDSGSITDQSLMLPTPKNIKPSFPNFDDNLTLGGFASPTPIASGASMEDFDSAFASLPLPSSSKTTEPANSSTPINNHVVPAFDDTFGDSFTPTGHSFENSDFESLCNFDGKADATSTAENLGNPFKVSSNPPPQPPRPPNSALPDSDLAKTTDGDAVKQICGMGFPRTVAIQALERDNWDMEKALNRLLGA